MLYIHPDECVDCGACEPVCPVEAIYYEDDLPEKSGATTTRPTSSSSTRSASARPAVPPRSASSPATTRSSPRCRRRSRLGTYVPLDASRLPLGLAASRTASVRRAHPDGIVDLAIGSPVDPTPQLIQDALAAAGDAPGYPQTAGSPALRQAIVDWFARRHGVTVERRQHDADDRLERAHRPDADAARPRPRRRRGAADCSPTRPTQSGAAAVGATVLASDGSRRVARRDAAGLAQQPRQPRRPRSRRRLPEARRAPGARPRRRHRERRVLHRTQLGRRRARPRRSSTRASSATRAG